MVYIEKGFLDAMFWSNTGLCFIQNCYNDSCYKKVVVFRVRGPVNISESGRIMEWHVFVAVHLKI